ncbi:MAG TPA: nucleotide pyrophosphatase/phosphodiesterase family protein [Jiangellaceae bacterium]|nr:nucleotide pyrophosphatase/phosphodiesterase family protein [Jiangellaceae bacterium]
MTTAGPAGTIVLPRYGEASLTDVLPSVLGALGVAGEQNDLGLPAAWKYCVLLIDGLGWNALRAHQAQAPFLNSMAGVAITASVPSTTVTCLTSLGTGLAPGRHGLLGYTTRKPGTATTLFNALKWDEHKDVDPVVYQPHPTVFERAARAGVAVTVLGQRKFNKSGLTTAALRSPGFAIADSMGERVALAAAAIADSSRPALVYVYDGDLDFTGHQRGCRSAAWRHQLAVLDRFVEELYLALPHGAVLLVTADHGMVDVTSELRIDVDQVTALRDGVALVGGEARFRHVYAADGAAGDVLAAWRDVLGSRATVLLRDDAIARGWFGAVEARVVDRIGDVVASIDGDCAVEYRSVFPIEAKLIGLHGALSADEMLVPLLTLPC